MSSTILTALVLHDNIHGKRLIDDSIPSNHRKQQSLSRYFTWILKVLCSAGYRIFNQTTMCSAQVQLIISLSQ